MAAVTIVFRIPASAVERVGFAYSPSMEAVLSLHVLVEPKHHPVQHGRVRAMRGLSPALKRLPHRTTSGTKRAGRPVRRASTAPRHGKDKRCSCAAPAGGGL